MNARGPSCCGEDTASDLRPGCVHESHSRAARSKRHSVGGFNNRDGFPHSSGGAGSKNKVSGDSVSPAGPLLGLQMGRLLPLL